MVHCNGGFICTRLLVATTCDLHLSCWESILDNFTFAQDPYVYVGCFIVDLKNVSPYAICAHWGIFGFQVMVFSSLSNWRVTTFRQVLRGA